MVLVVPGPATAGPGDVGAGVRTTVLAEGFGPGANGLGDFWNESVSAIDGVAESDYNYPPPTSTMPDASTCDPDGCGSWSASSMASVDVAAGRLAVYSRTRMLVGGVNADNAGYSQVWTTAFIDDTITLSEPAVVTLEGTLTAALGASHSHHEWYGDPDAELRVRAMFSAPTSGGDFEEVPWEDLGGLEREYLAEVDGCAYPTVCVVTPETPLPGPDIVNESFSIEVALPAGTSFFNAEMRADIDILLWGAQGDEHASWHSGSALLDSANSLEFVIRVPDGIVATSGSGLLPIVGGASTPEDTMAPEVSCETPDGAWHPDNVDIACTASDAGSGLADAADAAFSLSTTVPDGAETDDALTNSREVCDQAGNCTIAGPIGGNMVDRKAPTIVFGSVSPAANANGWHQGDVVVSFTATDGGAGVASSTPATSPLVLTAEGHAVSGSVTVTDAVGNVATASSPSAAIDRTNPVIEFTGNAGTYELGDTVDIECTASDALSGIDTSNCVGAQGPAYLFDVGANVLAATATDRAGNMGAASTTFEVIVTVDGISDLVDEFVDNGGVASSLKVKLDRGAIRPFVQQLEALAGKKLSVEEAELLIRLAAGLAS